MELLKRILELIGEIPEESENCHTILHTITRNIHELKRHDLLYFLAKLVREQEELVKLCHEYAKQMSTFPLIFLGIKK